MWWYTGGDHMWWSAQMRTRLTRWALFALLMQLAPLTAALLIEGSTATGTGLVGVISTGQLVLVGVALAATSIGEVLPASKEFGSRVLLAVGLAVFFIIVATGYYGSLSIREGLVPERVAGYSGVLYGFAILTSLSCIVIAQKVADA